MLRRADSGLTSAAASSSRAALATMIGAGIGCAHLLAGKLALAFEVLPGVGA
jgi:hypothetical protein